MDQPPHIPETPPSAAPQGRTMSLPARLLNIFAVPGEVLGEVVPARPTVANWLVPAIISSMVGVTAVVIMFSQPAILQRIREPQERAIEQRMDKLVKEGKMSRADADKQIAFAENFMGPTVMKISGAVAAVFWSFARLFLWGLALWLLGRWLLNARFAYLKAVEIAGLAAMISVLGTIVKLLLQVNFSNPASSPSLALVVGQVDPRNPLHLALAALNLFDLWEIGVMSAGLARLAGGPFSRALFGVLSLWAVVMTALIAISALVARLTG